MTEFLSTSIHWLLCIHSVSFQSYGDIEKMDLEPVLKVPAIVAFLQAHDRDPSSWMSSSQLHVAGSCSQGWLQIWFTTFPAGFPRAKSIGKQSTRFISERWEASSEARQASMCIFSGGLW